MDTTRIGSPALGISGMKRRGGLAVIVWSPRCQRTSLYAKRLDAPLYNIHFLKVKRPLLAPIKYVYQCIKTWIVLYRQDPSIIYVKVSPIFAALSVYLYCLFSGAKFIMDVHGNSMTSWKWKWSVPLHRFVAKRALLNIVDQEIRTNLFSSWGAKTMVLADPPVDISYDFRYISDPLIPNVTVVNNFDIDEPVAPILEAARKLPNVLFHILGDTSLADKYLLRTAPENVAFTGYLLRDEYWNRLYSSNAVMVLTTEPYSLLAGAQDGMAVKRPLILSNQPALVTFFSKGAVFIEHTSESVVRGVQTALEQESKLSLEITALGKEKGIQWEEGFRQLVNLIRETPC
jgi:glycosyltransferase involved in cell wall biosynthesis